MSTGSSSSSVFSGSSRYSSDFASVIQRSVSIASLPLTILRQARQKTDDEANALTALSVRTSSLESALSDVENAFGSSALSAGVSNPAAAAASVTTEAQAGTWQVSIGSLGASTAFVVTGFPAVTDVNAPGYLTGQTQTLILDTDPTDGDPSPEIITLSPPGTSLQSLAGEINRQLRTRVQATVVNVGTSSAPNYQLSLQSRKLGPIDITLTDGAVRSGNTAAQRGSPAKYTVNGSSISTDSRTVTLAPGVSMEMKAVSADAFTVGVQSTNASLRTALQRFAQAYNGVRSELDKSRGDSSAALAGSSTVGAVQDVLRRLMADGPAGSAVRSLADLGMSFDKQGVLSLDEEIFSNATVGSGLAGAQAFLSPSSGGGGWLQSAKDLVGSLTRPASGLLNSALQTTKETAATQQKQIDIQQVRIDDLEKNLQERMAAADAAIAMLEQQVTYFTGMFAAMKSNQGALS